ncbi:hypothetical protein [Photorhabdus sp. SF281]|uniref:hypothetical protein n=1 Tax=Photorhabdus sp. SF281 TaxID=3459527 RepID=UPI0040445FED
MNSTEKCKRLLELFFLLKDVIKNERDNEWLININDFITMLTPPYYGGIEDANVSLKRVSDSYKTMGRGNGSFSDYFIWREDFEERMKANEKFDDVKKEIWHILDNL